MNKYILLTTLFIVSCTSKNRFDPKENQTHNNAGSQNIMTPIKGTIEDIESDAIPYLVSYADTPRWNAKLGMIQDQIFDIKLDLSFDKKICFGILKRIQDSNAPGEFFVGEVNSSNEKIQVQFYVEKNGCIDNEKQSHNARMTMLLNGKEYYSCADYVNNK